jgi:hypothetical protein
MPGASLDHEARVLTTSQSWLQDFQRCPERARRELLEPSFGYNDATAVGTALHLFMEGRLLGRAFDRARHDATTWLDATRVHESFRYVKVMTPETMFRHLDACIDGMERHVLRQVPQGGQVEETLRAPLAATDDGWRIMLEGTPDYVDPFLNVWDWKSAGSEYNVWETANWSIQPTSYTFLASAASGEEVNDFTYAIAVKPHGSIQLIDTVRGPQEWAWLGRVAQGALSMCRTMLDQPWPVVHTHHLCDPKWCPAWDTCRGQYVSVRRANAA